MRIVKKNLKFLKKVIQYVFQKKHHIFEKDQYLYNVESSRKIINQLSCRHENTNKPYIIKIKNGIVLPRKNKNERDKNFSLGGVLNEKLEFIEESKEYDFGGGYDINVNDIEEINEEVIYLGRGYPHYGVVMIDLIRRLYFKYTNEGKKFKLCFLGIHCEKGTFGKAEKKSWELLGEMGLKRDDFIDIRKPTKFSMVYIPEPGFEYEKYYHKEFLIPYKIIQDKVKPRNAKKLYLSRRKMDTIKEVGEDIIEKFFSINGFKIIYPDELSIQEQVEWLKGAEVIASVECTASHNILFCVPGTKQIVIRKYTRIEPRHFLFNELMNSKVTYIDCMFNFIPGFPIHYDIGPFCMLFNKNISHFAKENNYILPKGWYFKNIITMIKYVQMCTLQFKKEKSGVKEF